jgi:hypothetical protein
MVIVHTVDWELDGQQPSILISLSHTLSFH